MIPKPGSDVQRLRRYGILDRSPISAPIADQKSLDPMAVEVETRNDSILYVSLVFSANLQKQPWFQVPGDQALCAMHQ